MKKLEKFLKAFLFVQLGACAGRILAQYLDYKLHPGIYLIQSAPWYTRSLVTLLLTGVTAGFTAIAYFIVRHKNKSANKECPG